ncbi:MAG TPA: methyltransferase domain-containing protein [Bryobacteraceae bacterium]|nr:methyltransferase domain-containing protein [Bryobacteraceae bacterium]
MRLRASGPRIIRQEILDQQTAEAGKGSLSDLIRINQLFGGHALLLRTLGQLFRRDDRFTMLDIGAASGDMGDVVRKHFPQSLVTCLDYKLHHLARASPPVVCGDAFLLPFRPATYDVVHCSLFLHHFTNEQVVELLRGFGCVAARHLVVTDLERHPLAYYFLPATRWIFGWDAVTLHDGPISVEAAFKASELEALARQAGLSDATVRAHHPSFRLSLVASALG